MIHFLCPQILQIKVNYKYFILATADAPGILLGLSLKESTQWPINGGHG